jgi:hypothetical protein
MTHFYRLLLRFYPAEYRELFGDEIGVVLQQAATEKRAEGKLAFASFVMREIAGVLAGVPREWTRTSQPPALAESAMTVVDSEKRIRFLVKRMEYAIANHDFDGARFYAFEDRKERANLERLRVG